MTSTKERLQKLGRWSVPQRFRPDLRVYLAKAGFDDVPYFWFGILLITSIATTFILYLIILQPLFSIGVLGGLALTLVYFIIANLLFYAIAMGGAAFYFNFRIYNRRKEIEENLPDMLKLISANLKGGLPFDKALWNAIRPEFGLLAEEMATVSKKTMTGHSLHDALQEFSQKYNSPMIRRTMNIILGQLNSGGKIAWIIDQVVDNLRKTKELKQELSANTLTYIIFISSIVLVIAPLLFALSFNLLNILLDVSGDILPQIREARESGADQIPDVPEMDVDTDAYKTFSFLALGIIAVFSSMIISIIQRGDILGGIKYVPFFVGIAITLYFVFLNALTGMFSFAA